MSVCVRIYSNYIAIIWCCCCFLFLSLHRFFSSFLFVEYFRWCAYGIHITDRWIPYDGRHSSCHLFFVFFSYPVAKIEKNNNSARVLSMFTRMSSPFFLSFLFNGIINEGKRQIYGRILLDWYSILFHRPPPLYV